MRGESDARTKVLAPGAIAKDTLASVTVNVRFETVRPLRRAMSRSRTTMFALALPAQTPPSLSHANASEIAPRRKVTPPIVAIPASVGVATGAVGVDGEAGEASACAHPLTHAAMASTRVNTDGFAVLQPP